MNKVKENMLWNSIGSMVYLGGQWLLTILVVRTLGYKDAGVLSLAMSLTNTFYAFANYGIRNFQISDLNGQFSDKEYICNRAITSIIAVIGCVSYCISQGYSRYIFTVILWFMLFRVCEAFQDVYYGIEQKNSDMKSIGISNILKGAVGTAVFFVMVIWSKSLNHALIAMLLVILLVLLLYDIRHAKRYIGQDLKIRYIHVWKILLVCAPIALNSFITNYILTYPKLIIERVMGEEALGIYSSIATPVLIVQIVASYITAPLTVIFAQYYQRKMKSSFFKLFLRVMLSITLLGLIALIGTRVAGSFFLKVLFGEDISRYIYIMYPLILCTVLTAVVWFFDSIVIICRNYVAQSVSSVVSLVTIILIIQNMSGGITYNGVSYALCIALAVKLLIMLVAVVKAVGGKGNEGIK